MPTDQARFTKHLRSIVGLGLMLRLIVVLVMRDVPVQQNSDPYDYVRLGNRVATGHWLTYPGGMADFSRPPGYPIFLGLVIKLQVLLGLGEVPLRLTAGIVQSVLAAAAIWLFARTIQRRVPRFGNRLATLTAGLLSITYLDLLIWPAALMTEALWVPLLITGSCLLLWEEQPRWSFLLGSGAVFGYCILVRSASIPVVGMAGLLAITMGTSPKTALRNLGVFASGLGIILAPWLIYAKAETGRVLIDTTSGQNWCLASSEHATGQWNPNCAPNYSVDPYIEMDRQVSEAQQWSRDHPAEVLAGRLRNLAKIPSMDFSSWGNVRASKPATIITVCYLQWRFVIITGSLAFWRRDKLAARKIRFFRQLLILTLATLVAPVLTFQNSRFNVGLLPFMLMCTAYWLCTTRCRVGRAVRQKLAELGVRD